MTQLADEILIAYADGELGPAQMHVVDGVLATDDVTLHQFQQLEVTNRRLSRAFSSMLQAQAKQDLVDRASSEGQSARQPSTPVRQGPPGNIFVPAIAASLMLVAMGAIGGYVAGNKSDNDGGSGNPFGNGSFWTKEQLKAEEARSKRLFSNANEPKTTATTSVPSAHGAIKWYEAIATRHKQDAALLLDQYDGKSRNRELALFQFSQTDIAPALIPVLSEEELTFVGASPVQIGGQHYARLAYRDRGNGAVPVGLYVGNDNGGSLTLERGYDGDDNYVRWTQGDRSYMLIGPVPHWRLIVLSVSVQRQLVQ